MTGVQTCALPICFGPDRDGVRDLGFGPFTEALNREDRAALRQAFLAKAPDLRQARQRVRAQRRCRGPSW